MGAPTTGRDYSSGHGSPQLRVRPSAHSTTGPSQLSNRQPWLPRWPASQVKEQALPGAQCAEQLPSTQVKAHSLSASQRQVPFAHSPEHCVFPSQVTWQGPAEQVKSQVAPGAQSWLHQPPEQVK